MSRRKNILVAAAGLLAITVLFLFPLQWGSFTATHGPATALRAKRFCSLLLMIVASLALRIAKFPVALRAAWAPADLFTAYPLLSPLKLTCSLLC
jgi:hypothetical protein